MGGGRDGGVGPDDGFVGDGVTEADHEMLAHWKAEGLGWVFEFEGEDDGVGGDVFFGVEDSFGPKARLEEGGSGWSWC